MCFEWLRDWRAQLIKMVRIRQDPESDYFEENLVANVQKQCVEWGECAEGQKTLNEVLNELPAPAEGEGGGGSSGGKGVEL